MWSSIIELQSIVRCMHDSSLCLVGQLLPSSLEDPLVKTSAVQPSVILLNEEPPLA